MLANDSEKQIIQVSESDPNQIILQAKKEFDAMIDQLNQKIKNRIELNESQLLIGYKQHLINIEKHLKIFKDNEERNQKIISSDVMLECLIKQCAFFRQQAMRLSTQLQNALSKADVYKRKAQILEKQADQNHEYIKKMMSTCKNYAVQNQKKTQIMREIQKERSKSELKTERYLSQQNRIKTIQTIHEKRPSTGKKALKIQSQSFSNLSKQNFVNLYEQVFHNSLNNKKLSKFHFLTQNSELRQSFGTQIQFKNEFENFKLLNNLINQARQKLYLQQGNKKIRSKTINEFILDDQDICLFLSKVFWKFTVRAETTKFGQSLFKAKLKRSNKKVVHLSTQLMKKIINQTEATKKPTNLLTEKHSERKNLLSTRYSDLTQTPQRLILKNKDLWQKTSIKNKNILSTFYQAKSSLKQKTTK